jgi:hypothetical protein
METECAGSIEGEGGEAERVGSSMSSSIGSI